MLDAEDLLPTERSIQASFSPGRVSDLDAAVAQLKDRGLLFQRGAAAAFRLWPNSSVSLDAAISTAARAIGPVDSVAAGLGPHLDHAPVLARRHYVERGTLRYFELRYATADAMEATVSTPADADGIVLVSLADTEEERRLAVRVAKNSQLAARDDVVVGVVEPLLGLASELHELRCWQWVSDNTPELAEDAFAAAEVARQIRKGAGDRRRRGRRHSWRRGHAHQAAHAQEGKCYVDETAGGGR